MKKNIVFIAVMVSVFLLLYNLSKKEVLPLPADGNHLNAVEEECLDCHGDDKEFPRKKDHPPKDMCILCHKKPVQGAPADG